MPNTPMTTIYHGSKAYICNLSANALVAELLHVWTLTVVYSATTNAKDDIKAIFLPWINDILTLFSQNIQRWLCLQLFTLKKKANG